MQIHDLKPKNKLKKKKRIGRGGKRGTYSGKGMKGQKSRAGANMPPIIREALKRYPKLRGYQFSPFKKVSVVNISILDKVFDDGAKITPKALKEKGLAQKSKNREIKVLGNGETKKKFFVSDLIVSKTARETIESAGGKIGRTVKHKAQSTKKPQSTNKKEDAKNKQTKGGKSEKKSKSKTTNPKQAKNSNSKKTKS